MGNMICKGCSNRTSTVTFHCEYSLALLYSDREMNTLFAVTLGLGILLHSFLWIGGTLWVIRNACGA